MALRRADGGERGAAAYSRFVGLVRYNVASCKMAVGDAMEAAIDRCIDEECLPGFFKARRAEVSSVFLDYHPEEEARELIRAAAEEFGIEQGLEQGIKEGMAQGIEQGLAKGRAEKLRQAAALVAGGKLDAQTAASAFGFTVEEMTAAAEEAARN